MKLKSVLMLLIGMISFTAMASTPLLDKNQKHEITFETPSLEIDIVSVEDQNFVGFEFNTPKVAVSYTTIESELYPVTQTIVLSGDVGWSTPEQGRNSKHSVGDIHNKPPNHNQRNSKIPLRV